MALWDVKYFQSSPGQKYQTYVYQPYCDDGYVFKALINMDKYCKAYNWYYFFSSDFDSKGIVHHETNIWLSNVGHIAYFAHGRMRVNCQHSTEATQFSCTLIFGSWANDNAAVRVRSQAKEVDTELLSPSARLSLVSSSVSNWWKKFSCCPNKYDQVKFRLTLRDLGDDYHGDDHHDHHHNHHGHERRHRHNSRRHHSRG